MIVQEGILNPCLANGFDTYLKYTLNEKRKLVYAFFWVLKYCAEFYLGNICSALPS